MNMSSSVFIHIPRTGGLSVRAALGIRAYCNRARIPKKVQGLVTFCHMEGLIPEDAFTFAFCRNPYDRLVSLWAFNNRENGLVLSFDEFCRGLGEWRWGKALCQPQVTWLDGIDLDFLGRFENLNADFGILCDKLGMARRPLPHVNAANHRQWEEYYNLETLAIVQAYYWRDFERFDYVM